MSKPRRRAIVDKQSYSTEGTVPDSSILEKAALHPASTITTAPIHQYQWNLVVIALDSRILILNALAR